MLHSRHDLFVFFFQAEDGIRDLTVTGVQTCALPISAAVNENWSAAGIPCVSQIVCPTFKFHQRSGSSKCRAQTQNTRNTKPAASIAGKIGRASCRERV